jgi:hypothetical protein
VIGYGNAGNSPDILKDAIADAVLANSNHTRDEWITILPDLFLVTEWLFSPLSTSYSVPDKALQAGIYSPIVSPAKVLTQMQKTVKGPGYTANWIASQYEIGTLLYKSLAFGVVGNPQNRGGVTQFSQKFPDYFLVTNDSDDANRMSPETLEFLNKFLTMVRIAETMTRFTPVPSGYARVVRDGLVYISTFYQNVNYLVLSKPSLEALT